ncbi:hypothetical protein D187_006200 [Cystobacter fuscus DSM 2262]|uniref:Uncharacterized protein n=1 Tax=Cystobacter fuscus (strain ATCC 25194 / DSM 2262 / NBRC 100088 / M29) TaxID=1242864 RepID=S9P5I9_CYSF2|nr:hypothetical protein D187_006200 [Cystobacter fuscus DSM 2262]
MGNTHFKDLSGLAGLKGIPFRHWESNPTSKDLRAGARRPLRAPRGEAVPWMERCMPSGVATPRGPLRLA